MRLRLEIGFVLATVISIVYIHTEILAVIMGLE